MLNSAISNGKKRWSDQNYYIVKALSAIYLKSNPNPDFTEKDYKMKCEIFDIPNDNTCFIYDVRPKACSEYPHTNRKKFIQLTNLTIKNTEVCPATYRIVEELKKRLPN